MLDAIRSNKRIVQIFLLLIMVPFAVWGLESYFQGGGTEDLVRIGRVRIGLAEFRNALANQQEELRRANPNAHADMLDSPQMRRNVLDGLINRRLLLLEAGKRDLNGRRLLQTWIANVPDFQENGVFNQARYEAVLAANRLSVAQFEADRQDDLLRNALLAGIIDASFMPQAVTQRIITLQTETREVESHLIPWTSQVSKIARFTPEEIQQVYNMHPARFTRPEEIRVEYVVLSQNALADKSKSSEAEIRAWYETHRDQFVVKPEARRLRHILLMTKPGEETAKVRAEAEALLAEIKKDPSRFAELAKTRSQDPGSAQQGGDLGSMTRGMLVKPFADAAFSLPVGEISSLVQSEFGFHIIRVDDIEAAETRPFADVRAEAETAMRAQNTANRFAEAAENFANLVYEESDSLKPAADAYGLKIMQSDWFTRETASTVFPSAKLALAMFSDEVVKNRRNTEAVEIMPGTLVAARILDHHPSELLSFETVRNSIQTRLTEEKAESLAIEQGEAKLQALREKNEPLTWGHRQTVSRLDPGNLPPEAVIAILQAAPPAENSQVSYVGVALPRQGYALYRIGKRATPDIPDSLKDALTAEMTRFYAQQEAWAYLMALRQRYKVKINETLLRPEQADTLR
jgi:peptidyl-prolyl cis-trans isomerase D